MLLKNISHVVENSTHVHINEEALTDFVKNLAIEKWRYQNLFQQPDFPTIQEKVQFLFLFNCVNFCFWGEPKWTVTIQNEEMSGSRAMYHVLLEAAKKNPQLLSASYMKTLSLRDLKKIVGNVPLLKERCDNINEAGRELEAHFDGQFYNLITQSAFETSQILTLIVKYFYQYNDVAWYKGKEVEFFKRAQILTSMVSKIVNLKGIDLLSAFADYKIPQVFSHWGILFYSKELDSIITNQHLIDPGTEMEVEIRANTVWAVELIKEKLKKLKAVTMTSEEIDSMIWSISKLDPAIKNNHHRTISIYY